MKKSVWIALSMLLPSLAWANPPAPPGMFHPDVQDTESGLLEEPLRLSHDLQVRGVVTNVVSDPLPLRGYAMGPLYPGVRMGSDTGSANDLFTGYVAQRYISTWIARPTQTRGWAELRAQLEVGYAWGAGGLGVGTGSGGGIGANQVNLGLRNLHVEIAPTRDARAWSVLVGTQPALDTPLNPTRTAALELESTGYRGVLLHTNATGAQLYSDTNLGILRAGVLPLGSSQPRRASDGDARVRLTTLAMLDYARRLGPGSMLGATYSYLQDNTQGDAFAYQGLVRAGPTAPRLSDFTGTRRVEYNRAVARVHHVGAHGHHNVRLSQGRLGGSGFVLANVGEVEEIGAPSGLPGRTSILGGAAMLEGLARWGETRGDRVGVRGLIVSGDADARDDRYTTLYSMNHHGMAGASLRGHEMLLLFPDRRAVHAYTGAVLDVSNRGYGLLAITADASWQAREDLRLKVGVGWARALIDPEPSQETQRADPGTLLGTEFNVEALWEFLPGFTLGGHAAYLLRGDFFSGYPQSRNDPMLFSLSLGWRTF